MAVTELRRTACSLDCFDACGIVAEVEGDRIVRLGGDPRHPFTRGALCQKVNRYLDTRYYHPDRVLHPLRRTASGWQQISWDDALDLAVGHLARTREHHGSLSVLYHKGNGSFAGLKIMGERFFNLFGGVTQAVGRFCGGEADYGTVQSFGACAIHDPLDLAEHTRLFLIWGRNPAVTNVHMMPVIKEARARGARAIVIDPVVTKTVRYCDGAVHPRPGSDGHLAVGMAKVILARRRLSWLQRLGFLFAACLGKPLVGLATTRSARFLVPYFSGLLAGIRTDPGAARKPGGSPSTRMPS